MRFDQAPTLPSSPHHHQMCRIASSQPARRQRGGARGAPRGQLFAIHKRQRLAIHPVEQNADRRHRARLLARKHCHELHAYSIAHLPGRHQEQ
jgi:hypothetical protein